MKAKVLSQHERIRVVGKVAGSGCQRHSGASADEAAPLEGAAVGMALGQPTEHGSRTGFAQHLEPVSDECVNDFEAARQGEEIGEGSSCAVHFEHRVAEDAAPVLDCADDGGAPSRVAVSPIEIVGGAYKDDVKLVTNVLPERIEALVESRQGARSR